MKWYGETILQKGFSLEKLLRSDASYEQGKGAHL